MRSLLVRRALAALLALGVVSASPVQPAAPSFAADSASAQEVVPAPSVAPNLSALPTLGGLVAEDALTEGGAFRPYFCPTGRNQGQVSPDGYRLTVTGRCIGELPSAGVRVQGTGMTVGDGDVELEVRGTGAVDRAVLALSVRVQENGDGYQAVWDPTLGRAALQQLGDVAGERAALRTDLPPTSLADGARIAVRAHGPTLWLLLNGEPVLSLTDATFDAGGIGIGLARRGNPDEDAEVTVTWRNLRLAGLADGDAARAPTYRRPAARPVAVQPPAPSTAPPFVPITGSPPAPGAAVLTDPLNEPSPLRSFQCDTGNGAVGSMGEGLQIWINGPCRDTSRRALMLTFLGSLVVVPDGEIRFDFKVTDGPERVALAVQARGQAAPGYGAYEFYLAPGLGIAGIAKVGDGNRTTLSQRVDVGALVSRDGWNTMAIRMRGPELWLLLNDQPVVKVEDRSYLSPAASGYTTFILERLGPIEDKNDAGVILRNLRISELEGGPRDRRPKPAGLPD